MHSFFLASLLGALLCAPVLATAQVPVAAATAPTSYVLGPDDQITIQVADAPDISGKPQRIDPNGDLRLPMVGRVRAEGLTVDQLEAELITLLKVHLQEPDVAVTVTAFRSQPVSVIGAVTQSGVRPLEGRKTLIEVLSQAGGVTADAGPTLRMTRRIDRRPHSRCRTPLPTRAASSASSTST